VSDGLTRYLAESAEPHLTGIACTFVSGGSEAGCPDAAKNASHDRVNVRTTLARVPGQFKLVKTTSTNEFLACGSSFFNNYFKKVNIEMHMCALRMWVN
jgi:hypothetical protein